MSSRSKFSTATSPSQRRYRAVYAPTPEHMAAPGIPARDLTPDEVDEYTVEWLRNARCYELVPAEAETPEPEAEPEAETGAVEE